MALHGGSLERAANGMSIVDSEETVGTTGLVRYAGSVGIAGGGPSASRALEHPSGETEKEETETLRGPPPLPPVPFTHNLPSVAASALHPQPARAVRTATGRPRPRTWRGRCRLARNTKHKCTQDVRAGSVAHMRGGAPSELSGGQRATATAGRRLLPRRLPRAGQGRDQRATQGCRDGGGGGGDDDGGDRGGGCVGYRPSRGGVVPGRKCLDGAALHSFTVEEDGRPPPPCVARKNRRLGKGPGIPSYCMRSSAWPMMR